MSEAKPSRKQQILETLARELESAPGERITTAGLARSLGVSEAALYRHFASKAQMYEGLIEFAEQTLFSTVHRINAEQVPVAGRARKVIYLLLGFAERNPGISRVLSGDALVGEKERLRNRAGKLFDRLELELKQMLREAELHGELPVGTPVQAIANLLLAVAEGLIHQFVQSGFQRKPLALFEAQWRLLVEGLFPPGKAAQ
ncbi:nucleoid occlusion factor SlmA [Endothiovibrio diazotrophicus]